MDGIFQEISQEMKRDRLNSLLKRYGFFILTFFIVLICCIGFWFWWQDYKEKQILIEAEAYNQVLTKLQNNDSKGAYDELEKLTYGNTIYAQMAALQLASISLHSQNFHKAIAEYNSIVKNDKVDGVMRDYAQLMLIKTEYIANKINDEEALKRLNNYIHNSNNYIYQAKFLRANILIKIHEFQKAKGDLNEIINNPSLPPKFIYVCEMLKKSLR